MRLRPALAGLLVAAVLAAIAVGAPPAGADRSGSTQNDRIARLYLGVFGRSPDLGGEAFWNHQSNDGVTLRRMAEVFVDSPEFRERFGTGDEVVLTALYRNVLDREPDAAGFAWWQDQIANGMAISEVVVNFTESPEHIASAVAVASRYDSPAPTSCDTPIDAYLQAYVERMELPVTIAVHDLTTDCAYGLDADELMTTASTIKLAVMGSMMLRAQDQGRLLTETELNQLDGMIRFSDDPDVRPIVNSMGGTAGMLNSYGPRLGITSFTDATAWGCVAWSASSATGLIEHLTVEGISELNAEHRAIAIELLTTVTPSQQWGVHDGTVSALGDTGSVAQKNGFARSCGAGARTNSVGIVFDADGNPQYSVAIYTTGWVDGVAASRSNDQPAYVLAARNHMDHIAEHIARFQTR